MRRSGICMICGQVAEPAYSCKLCGMIVCGEHFDKRKGICTSCAAGRSRPFS